MEQKDLAVAQLVGFTHADEGYNIESLAENMGLTKTEWALIRDDPCLLPRHRDALDTYFSKR